MRPLASHDVVRIWEVGLGQHPVDRALTILMAAFPELPQHELAALSIGQRDARLLGVRERAFGPQLSGFAECPECHARLEFDLRTTDINASSAGDQTDQVQQMRAEGYELSFRLPNSLDLAAIATCPDVPSARTLLIRRCVSQSRREGAPVDPQALPEAVIEALGAQIVARDPQAEVRLDLSCPACGHRWQLMLDVVAFLWGEISAEAKRLLRQVHTLAGFYGWREADILSMSAARRRFYLELLT